MRWGRQPSVFWGFVLVAAGAVFLLANLNLLSNIEWNVAWPLLLIGLGVLLLVTRIGVGGVSVLDSAAQREGLTAARLEIAVGAADLDVKAAGLGDQLYRAHVEHTGNPPEVTFDRPTGTLRIAHRPDWMWFGGDRLRISVTLSDALVWTVDCSTGATHGTVDLASAQLARLAVKTGASRVQLGLPAPKGTVPVSMEGGSVTLDVSLPAAAAVKVHADGAAVHLRAGGVSMDGLGAREWKSPDFDGASDRFDVHVAGGAATVNVTRRST